jgi:hypothetical protein
VWTLDQAITYIQAGTWPYQPTNWIASLTFSQSYSTYGYGIALNPNGNIYVTGRTPNGIDVSGNQMLLAGYNPFGTLQWKTGLQDTALSNNYVGYKTAIDSSNNVYMIGVPQGYPGQIVKYNSSGVLQWKYFYGAANTIATQYIKIDSSNNIYVLGGSSGLFLIKYNTSGTVQWDVKLGSASYTAAGLALDSSGNIYVSCTNTAATGIIIAKYNSSGAIQWQRSFLATASDFYIGKNLTVDSAGSVYSVGSSYDSAINFQTRLQIVKYDSSGAYQWQRIVYGNSPYPIEGWGICSDSSNNIYATGSYLSSDGTVSGILIVKYNSSGTIQWQRVFTNVANSGYDIVADNNGAFCVVGRGSNASNSWVFVARLPTDGSLTGTYSLGGISGTYSASSQVASSSPWSDSASSLTSTTPSTATSTSAFTVTTPPSIASAVTTIP